MTLINTDNAIVTIENDYVIITRLNNGKSYTKRLKHNDSVDILVRKINFWLYTMTVEDFAEVCSTNSGRDSDN